MTAALFRVQDLGSVMGGWPFMRSSDGSSETQIIGGVIDSKARIVGTVQEPSGGFAGLDTLSFQLYVDSDPNSPFTVTFSDPGASGLTCDDVVTQINTTTTPGPLPGTVAYNENNFVVLKSVTEGEGGYLKVASVAGSEAVAGILGLFSETEAFGGQLAQAPHIDPDRQVAMPGQGSMIWGENFSANAFNRLAMQMAVHADRSIGVLERKRLAVFKRKARAVADIQTSGSDKYFRLITTPSPTDEEWIYMGPYASGHAEFDPELAMAIVDADGNEITQDDENIVDFNSTPAEVDLSTNDDNGIVTIVDSGIPSVFASVTAEGDYYARMTDLVGPGGSDLNNILLKITRVLSASTVEVLPIDEDGNKWPLSNGSKGPSFVLEAVQIVTKKVKAEGFYKESSLTTRLEQVQETKVSSVGITGLQLNNRVVVSGESFLSTVVAGDIATISGHTNTVPHSNNGTYRVSKVVDNETLELVGEDWGPVYLNTQTAVSYGDLVVTSDGDFFDNPYVKFDDPDIVPTGDFFVLYQAMRTFRDAVDEDPGVFAAPTKYLQEGAHNLTKAVLGIVGPSVDNLTEANNWLYGDRRNNMEDLYARVNNEHHDHGGDGPGRHAYIRPDKIDMYPEVLGPTVTVRCLTNSIENSYHKLRLYNWEEKLVFGVSGQGHIMISDDAAGVSVADIYILNLNTSARVVAESRFASGSAYFTATTNDGDYNIYMQANTALNAVYLRMNTLTSGDFYLWLEDDVLELRGGVGTYFYAHEARGELVAGVDFVPETDTSASLGNPSTWWNYLYGQFLNVDNVDTDLVPTVDDSRALGAYSYRWRQIYLSYNLYIEELTGSQSFPSIFVDNRYSHLPSLAGGMELYTRCLGSDSASNVRNGVYSYMEWIGTDGGNNLWHMSGFHSNFIFSPGGVALYNVSNGYGLRSRGYATGAGGGKMLNFFHVHAANFTGASSGLDKQYGLYVEDLTLAALENWAVYTAGSTPSYFGGNVTVDGDLTVNGSDLTLTDGVDTLVDMGASGSDGFISVKDDTSLVQLTGTDLYYAREWAQLEKGANGANFIIGGLSLENDWGTIVADQLGIQQGIAWINGVVHRFGAIIIDGSAASSWLAGSVPSTGRWCWVFVHPTQGAKIGIGYPQYQLNKPNGSESMAGAGDTDRNNWLYVGSVYWDTGQEWRQFRRIGDMVWYQNDPTNENGQQVSNSWTPAEDGTFKDYGPGGGLALGSSWYPNDGSDTRIPGLIVGIECGASGVGATGTWDVRVFHGAQDSDHRILAARILMSDAYSHLRENIGPQPLMTQRVAGSGLKWHGVVENLTTLNMSVTCRIYGYIEPMNTPGSNRYIY